MVKVAYAPWEEIVIHEATKYSPDNLVKLQTLGIQAGALGHHLLWAEGVAFVQAPMPPTDDVIKEQLQGRIHWSGVGFAIMPEFKEVIVIKEGRVPVVSVSNNPILRTVATWLKEHAEEF